ncbi:MAG: winged helix-turn-helix transcriptional regulator [Actinomycetota bacterium]|nr:winged helix-turn-helix transcriptional regulator [Actinomycetota bacterium]
MSTVEVVVVLRPASRELRRILRPIEWVVLEDVALDARRDDAGLLVASTSAREVAEHLGLTPGAVARALARLRSVGLVTHARQVGPAGRFGLSAYALGPVPGLAVVEADVGAGVVPPHAAEPHIEAPRVVERHVVDDGAGAEEPRTSVRPPNRVHPIAAPAGAVDGRGSGRATSPPRRSRVTSRRPASPAAQLTLLEGPDLDHPSPKAQP